MNTIELLTHLARRYQDVKQPGYPFKRRLEHLENREITPKEFMSFKNRVVGLTKKHMEAVK